MKRILIFLPIVILLEYLLLNLPYELRYIENDRWIAGVVTLGLIFGIIPITIYLAVSKLSNKIWSALAIASIPVSGITFGTFTNSREIKDLKSDGVWTKAVVTRKKKAGKRAIEDWEVAIKYSVNNQIFATRWDPDYTGTIEVGDSVAIIYHSNFPELHRIKEEWEKSN